MLQRFATKKGWVPGERLHIVSLGQGQGPVAEALVEAGQGSGAWGVPAELPPGQVVDAQP